MRKTVIWMNNLLDEIRDVIYKSNPIIVSVHAVGKLKKFQIVEGSMLLLILPIAYILLKFWGIRPEYVFLVHILIEICTQFVRLKIVLPMIQMKLKDYLVKVIEPVILVIIVATIIYFVRKNKKNNEI